MLTWLNQRTGFVTMATDFLTEDVPGGASYWYAFGSATVFAMLLQITTGIFLTFYYSPTAATAWESTKYIIDKVPAGWLVLSLHYWGATAMIALMMMHLLQVLLWGAYKKPREMQWIVGVILFIVTLVLGLTGYLLPWDLNALLASKVAIQIAGSAPILGQAVLLFLQDGSGIGTLTINRFFGVHVWLTPAILILLVVMHLAIFRWNGPAGAPIDETPKLKPGRFWPDQMFMDTVLSFAVFLIVFGLAVFSPPTLDAKADPNNTQFVPYPAWYFMALFSLLDVVGQAPSWAVNFLGFFATIIFPTLLIVVLILLPFIDKNPSRRLSRRPIVLTLTGLVLGGAIALSFVGQYHVQQQQVLHGLMPAPAAAATATTAGASTAAGLAVFTTNCAGCHGASGTGQPGVFPPLAHNPVVTGPADKVIGIVSNGLTTPISVNGVKFSGMMPAWKGTLKPAEIADVITYIRSAWGNKASAVTTAQVNAAK
ncbi:MAG TPA: cytochrome b N-terminal domain-containing protein [Candidatus Lustribacter sp.]